MTYMTKNDEDFKDLRDDVNPKSKRKAQGWIIYQETEEEMSVSSSQGKRLTLTQMINRLKPKPQAEPQPGPAPTLASY